MKIYLGADHHGYSLKVELTTFLKTHGYAVVDEGDKKLNPDDDFPQFAQRVVVAMLGSDDPDPRGILICGSGQGMCMAANRHNGIRASVIWDTVEAKAARNDDDSNVLCLPARVLTQRDANSIVQTWLDTPFADAPRYVRRIKEMDELQ